MDNDGNDNKTNLIVNYLPQSMSDEEFNKLFSEIGTVSNSKIIRNKATNYSYGFGFVDYATAEDAAAAIEKLNGYQVVRTGNATRLTVQLRRYKTSVSRWPWRGRGPKASNAPISTSRTSR